MSDLMIAQMKRNSTAMASKRRSLASQRSPSLTTDVVPVEDKEANDPEDKEEDDDDAENENELSEIEEKSHSNEEINEEQDIPEETLKSMKAALNEAWSDIESPRPTEHVFEPCNFPPSYKNNDNSKEQTVLKVCKEAMRQFRDLYFDRRPLFFKPLNEFNVEKMVCTTICPTQLGYGDLLDWPEISHFLAGYLDYDVLRPAHMLPKKMFAPQTVLERKRGHCFEYATVLASMLIGAGYDAYVVSGHATREVTRCDLSYTPCPYIERDEKTFTKPISVNVCRYTMRPPKALASRYLMRMEMKRLREKKEMAAERQRVEDQGRAMREAPPPDDSRGWRVHAWVLVLPRKRDVTEPFFIEPSSGTSHAIGWDQYLGIESLWNHRNYYINVHQEVVDDSVHVCKRTVPAPFLFPINKMTFDIGDSRRWDYIFHWQDLHRGKTDEERTGEEKRGGTLIEDMTFDLPHSWSKTLSIPRDDYLRKYPTGKKTIRYKQSKVDLMADYLQPCGIVEKLWVYTDLECTSLQYSREKFAHRADFLLTRYFEQDTGKVIELFAEGRPDFIKEHHYYAQNPGLNTDRIVVYYTNKRTDELCRREEGPNFIRLHFGENTKDRMYKKETRYGPDGYTWERPDCVNAYSRPIESIEECYRRNSSVPVDEDIHKILYSVKDATIDIEYHVAEHRIVASTRHFRKPDNWHDASQVLSWDPALHHQHYDADTVTAVSHKEYQVYEMLIQAMENERLSRIESRMSERETNKLIYTRDKEEGHYKLFRPYFIAYLKRNTRDARLAEKAKAKAAIIFKKSDHKYDYLEPNIWRLGLDEVVNKKQATKVKDDCLKDLRTRLISHANDIKEEFDVVKKMIVAKQKIYHESFIKMSREEEEQSRADIMQHMFVAHILEHRMAQHREYAPVKYQNLIDTLHRDPRLDKFLI